MSEAADQTNSEPPVLRRIQNGRFRRLGRLSKRTGFGDGNTSVSPNSTALSGRPMLLGDFNGRNILVAGDGLLYTRSEDSFAWTESDRVPTFTPREAKEIARNDVSGPLDFPTVAAISGYILVAYANIGGGTFTIALYDQAGVKLWANAPLAGVDVKVLAATASTFVVVYRTLSNINARVFTPSTLTLGAAVAIGALNASTDNWDANVYSSTRFAVVYRDAALQARVELRDSSTLGLASSAAFPINNAQIMPAVWGQDPENIYVAWWDPTATRSVRVRVYDSALVLTSGGTVVMGDSVGFAQKPVIGRRNATSAHIIWSGNSSATDRVMRHRTITNAGVLGGTTSAFPNVHIASEPFDCDENKIRMWVQQPTQSTPVTTSGGLVFSSILLGRYVLVTLRLMTNNFEAQPELHTDAGWVPFAQTFEDLQTFQVAQTGVDYVCAVKRRIRGIPVGTDPNNTAVSLLRFRGSTRTPREAQRQGIEAQRVLHVTGGELIEHLSSAETERGGSETLTTGIENNFLQPPILFSGTAVAGGSLTSGAVYQYCATLECLDSAGRRTRSLPSNIVAVNPAAGNLTASLSLSYCGISGRRQKDVAQPVAVHIYRTLANGAIFYRVTSDTAAPNAFDYSGLTSRLVTDGTADTDVDERETLYAAFQAGNYPCPSHRFALQGGGRMFVGGLWDPTEVRCSKPFVLDEPVQFVEDDAFRILVPAPVTGLGWLDGTLVIFTERAIYIVSGDGPDRQGAGAFSVPLRLPGDVGCSDWRTVREVPQGLLFQSARGFYLIPRGFGAPVFQADVQETVDSNAYPLCFGAGRHEVRESTLVYLMGRAEEPAEGESVGLAYDLATGKWVSIDTYTQPFTLIGSWGSLLTAATDDLSTLALAFGEGDPDATYVELHAKTGQFHPFGFGGYGSVQEIRIYGEYRALAYIGIRVVIDGITSAAVELEPSSDTRNNVVNGVFLSSGEKWFYRWQCPKIEGNSFEVEVWDALDDALGSIGEGTAFHGISMLVDRQSGSKPLGSGNRG